jgi:hypothetical protein
MQNAKFRPGNEACILLCSRCATRVAYIEMRRRKLAVVLYRVPLDSNFDKFSYFLDPSLGRFSSFWLIQF